MRQAGPLFLFKRLPSADRESGSAFLEPQSRPRLSSPHHRGDHGYLPEHPSEHGFVILVDDGYDAPNSEASLIDIAPTVLSLPGDRPPASMKGRRLFRARTPVN